MKILIINKNSAHYQDTAMKICLCLFYAKNYFEILYSLAALFLQVTHLKQKRGR